MARPIRIEFEGALYHVTTCKAWSPSNLCGSTSWRGGWKGRGAAAGVVGMIADASMARRHCPIGHPPVIIGTNMTDRVDTDR